MKKSIITILMSIVLVFMAISFIGVQEASAAEHVNSIVPEADAHIQGGSGASNNFGASTTLQVRGNDYRTAYLRFDLSTIKGLSRTAKLKLRTANTQGGVTLRVAVANSDAWIEGDSTGTIPGAITGSNRPSYGYSTSNPGISSIVMPKTNNTLIELPIPISVIENARTKSTDTNKITLVLYINNEANTTCAVHSKESTADYRPVLEVVSTANDGFDERADSIIAFHSANGTSSPKRAFWYAEAKFYDYAVNGAGEAKLTSARGCVNGAIGSITDQFGLWGAMDCYLRYNNLYTQAMKDTVRTNLVNSTKYTADQSTPNKVLMSRTARYLASQAWPGETFADSFSADDPTGYNYLLAKCDEYAKKGPAEYNSATYYGIHYGCFRSLADLATDPVLKKKAALTAEALLINAAPEWLNGHWAAAQERSYSGFVAQNGYGPGKTLLWLYFGGPQPQDMGGNAEAYFSVQSVVSSYRPSVLITNMAQTRSEDYVHRESNYYYKSDWNIGYKHYLTSYINKHYGVFSQHDATIPMSSYISGFAAFYKQMLRWGVVWEGSGGPSEISSFFVQHPLNDKVENFGATAYEQVLQNKNTILGVYNIPASDPNPWLYGWIPGNAAAMINNANTTGRIYLNYRNLMIAMSLTETFTWDGVSANFQKPASKIGMVVEVADPNSYPGADDQVRLAGFKSAVDTKFDAMVWTPAPSDGQPVLKYTALDGTVLETKYNGTNLGYDKINNVAAVYDDSYPLLDNPWMKQDFNGNILTINDGIYQRVYNFSDWTVTQTILQEGGQMVTAPVFIDSSRREIPQEQLSGLTTITTATHADNPSDLEMPVTLLVAYYGANKALNHYRYTAGTIPVFSAGDIDTSIEVPESKEGTSLKVFVWKNLSDMVPTLPSRTIQF